MKNQKFGIEVETTGLSRHHAARIIADLLGEGSRLEHRSSYDAWVAIGPDGREWKAVSDSSVNTSGEGMAEIVSPICTWEDIDLIQAIIRALRDAGARTDASCGIHIHVSADGFDAAGLTRLTKMVAAKEKLVHAALGINPNRIYRWCRPVDRAFLERLESRKPKTLEAFAATWYNDAHSWAYDATEHYHPSRYHLLNLHATFQKGTIRNGRIERLGTIEYRAFDGTMHAGKIKAYLQFCLALTHYAKASKSACGRESTLDATKYTMRCWLLRLGFKGDEFKTARKHLMSLLPGDSAWRTPEQRAASR